MSEQGSFIRRMLKVELKLDSGQFKSGGNALTLVGYRMSGTLIVSAGGDAQGQLELAIYGLNLATMNQMTTLGKNLVKRMRNEIKLYAGEADGEIGIKNEKLIFTGQINVAYVDANSAPDVAFRISAITAGGYWSVKPTEPISKKGSQDVSSMLSKLAKDMELQYEDNGVKVKLNNPYFGGNPWNQARDIARAAGINLTVERGVMVATPPDKTRKSSSNKIFSRETGMVGYPMFREASILVKALLDPEVKIEEKITVQSDLTPANGDWKVIAITYEFACLMPRGSWFMTLTCVDVPGSPPAS